MNVDVGSLKAGQTYELRDIRATALLEQGKAKYAERSRKFSVPNTSLGTSRVVLKGGLDGCR